MSTISNTDRDEVLPDFIKETEELIGNAVEKLEKSDDSFNREACIYSLKTSFNAIKDASNLLGFINIEQIALSVLKVIRQLEDNKIDFSIEVRGELKKSIRSVLDSLKDIKKKNVPSVNSEEKDILRQEGGTPAKKDDLYKTNSEKSQKVSKAKAPFSEAKRTQLFDEQTIRVDIKRLDSVMTLVGELVLGKNQLTNLLAKFEEKYSDEELISSLISTSNHLNHVTTNLQLAVMRTRMQPIKKVFGKFPRLVRDLSRKSGKRINLEISGEDTELDKAVIEEIGDPLLHLIRNSIDHGIETKEIRRTIGKPDTATIKLSAYQEGNNIVIEIQDDGSGIDERKIGLKALEKGIVTEEELKELSRKDIINFIFRPGFSTAEEVTDISGRGVGMDVVRTNVAKLGGMIDIETEFGSGTTIFIRLPITVAILHSLMVKVGKDIFAIPLASVIEIIKITSNDIKLINHKEVVSIREQLLPLIRLKKEFNILTQKDESSRKQNMYTVILGVGEKQIAVIIDDLVGQQEVVIKSLGKYLSSINCFAGASIDGDGKVVLILDVTSLFQSVSANRNSEIIDYNRSEPAVNL